MESQVEIVNTLGQVVQRIDYFRLPPVSKFVLSTASLGKGVYFSAVYWKAGRKQCGL